MHIRLSFTRASFSVTHAMTSWFHPWLIEGSDQLFSPSLRCRSSFSSEEKLMSSKSNWASFCNCFPIVFPSSNTREDLWIWSVSSCLYLCSSCSSLSMTDSLDGRSKKRVRVRVRVCSFPPHAHPPPTHPQPHTNIHPPSQVSRPVMDHIHHRSLPLIWIMIIGSI